MGKGENAGNQHFLLFPQCFQRASMSGSLKVSNCVGKDECICTKSMPADILKKFFYL